MTPRSLFKTFALAEVVTWAGLITAMILRGVGVTDSLVPIAGGVHGFVFLAYCVVTVIVWVDGRWGAYSTGLRGTTWFLPVVARQIWGEDAGIPDPGPLTAYDPAESPLLTP